MSTSIEAQGVTVDEAIQVALNQLGIDHNSLDAIVLTHLHGDHCAGVPFLLMDAMLGAKRDRPLTITGPHDTRSRLEAIGEALFPGMASMTPKFALDVLELPVLEEYRMGPLSVISYPAAHTGATHPTSVVTRVAGKKVAYSGDSAWTKFMPEVAREHEPRGGREAHGCSGMAAVGLLDRIDRERANRRDTEFRRRKGVGHGRASRRVVANGSSLAVPAVVLARPARPHRRFYGASGARCRADGSRAGRRA